MLTNNLKLYGIQIISNLKVAFKSERQKYQPALEAESFKKEKQVLSDIEDVKSQITLLTKTSVMLQKEFVLCAEQAEKENDIFLMSKVNVLKRKNEGEKEDYARS